MRVAIHTNPHLKNQGESACWLSEGFSRWNISGLITDDKHAEADVHVVQGPHYAYNEWLGKPNVLFLNRCFYGHPRFDLSIGWLNADGSRDFKNHSMVVANGVLPTMRPRKESRHCAVVFGDYGVDPNPLVDETRMNHNGSLFFRPHPQQKVSTKAMTLDCDLEEIWSMADVAIGGKSTVLCEAAIAGLHVETTDPLHVVNGHEEEGWLTRLSWAQWSRDQIRHGDFWEHLCVQAD